MTHLSRQRPADSLSAKKIQMFLAGLSGLSQDEVRKAKELYVRNAISECRMMFETLNSSKYLMICFAIIPLFWPFIYFHFKTIKSQKRLFQERIQNALEV